MAIRPQRVPCVIPATILLFEVASSGESNPAEKTHDPPLQMLHEESDFYDVPLLNKDYRGIDPNVIESGDEILVSSTTWSIGALMNTSILTSERAMAMASGLLGHRST